MKIFLSALTLITCSASSAFAATYFLPGVSIEGGWHDAEKTWENDDSMCWAAQAANMTQYWQDWYLKAGNQLPDGTPNGYGTAIRSDGIPSSSIFETYKSAWSNKGGLSIFGIPWYFTGTPHPEYYNYNYDRKSEWSRWNGESGGFFAESYSGPEDFEEKERLLEHLEYDGGLSIQEFTEKMKYFITVEYSVIGLSIDFWNPGHAGGHAVTLWGMDIDEETDLVSAIYITDSDDDYYGIKRYNLETYYGGADIEMSTYLAEELRDTYRVTFDQFTSLSVSRFVAAIPEPSAFGFFAGLGALAIAFSLRREIRR